MGLCRPTKNIRFIIGEGRSVGRRCQSPERSGAEGRGSEHGAVLGYVPRRAAQAGLTGGADRSSRLRREMNVRKEDQPKAEPLNLEVENSVSLGIVCSSPGSSKSSAPLVSETAMPLERTSAPRPTPKSRQAATQRRVHMAGTRVPIRRKVGGTVKPGWSPRKGRRFEFFSRRELSGGPTLSA
jgi:hypothetical protein